MKHNRFYKFGMAAIVVAVVMGCASDEDIEQQTIANGQPLFVNVSDGGFVGQGETRATESGYKTTFTEGDKIGVFAVRDGAVSELANNLCLTYDGTEWTAADSDEPLVNIPNATYYAYYPYQETLTGDLVPTAEDAVGFFANVISNWQVATDQSTYADYTASDLMTVMGTVGGTSLALTMSHQMGLVVVDLPKTVYEFTDTSIPDYYVPTEVTWKETSPTFYYFSSDGTYRCIVNPAAASSQSVCGTYDNGGSAFSFTPSVTAGSYNLYAVDGATVTTIEAVGVEQLDGELSITTDDVFGLTGSGTGQIIINGSPTVVLYNYTNTISRYASSIIVNGGTPTIILWGTNTFNGGYNNQILDGQVISLCNGAGVIIDGQGDGTMIINSERTNGDDALIGSAAGDTAGDIVIKNTSLTLNMDYYNDAPIIGAGNGSNPYSVESTESSCGNITIENSTLNFSVSFNVAPFIGAGEAAAYKGEYDEDITCKSVCGDIDITNTIVNINLSHSAYVPLIGTSSADSHIMDNASGIAEALSKCGDVNMTNSSINVQATYR